MNAERERVDDAVRELWLAYNELCSTMPQSDLRNGELILWAMVSAHPSVQRLPAEAIKTTVGKVMPCR